MILDILAKEEAGDDFREYRDILMMAVTGDNILLLANSLYSRGIISRADLSHASLTTLIPEERNVHLFDAIEDGIRSKPEHFRTLLDILDREFVSRHHAEKLWTAFEVKSILYLHADLSHCFNNNNTPPNWVHTYQGFIQEFSLGGGGALPRMPNISTQSIQL